jgi:signal transduction histidine kinase
MDLPRRLSMRNRLIALSVACMLPLIGVVALLLFEAADAGREQVLDAQAATAEVVATMLATTLGDNQKVLQELASIDIVRRMEPARAIEALDQFSRAHPNLYGLFLLDQQGAVVASTGLDPGQFRVQPSFGNTVDRSLNLGEPGVSTALNAPDARVIALTVPVRAKDQAEGEPIGVVGSLLSVERLSTAVLPFARGDTLIAVVADGQVIAAQGDDPAVNALAASVVQPFSPTGPGIHTYTDAGGQQRLAVYAPVPGTMWGVLVTNQSPTAYAPNRDLINRAVVILLATLLGTLAVIFLLSELLARPLRQIESQADALAGGDFTPREPVQGGGEEIAGISAAFGVMAHRFGEQFRDLEQAREAGAAQAEQMRELNRRTIRLQEDERRRIAAEIHDAVSPLITGALYQARALRLGDRGDAEREGSRRDGALDSIGELLSQAMEELHGVVFRLRPPDLDDIGVVAAIERYIAQVQLSGLNARLETEEELPPLTPEVRLAIYRIVQEALHNALRHASADEALVRLETVGDTLRVTIRDNGAGFNPEHATRPTSLGLLSMRERAAGIGASFAVMSRPGDGTTVLIERRIEPEPDAAPQLAPVEEWRELPAAAPKNRIPA